MTLTRDNYEPYFLDFLEGNLDEGKIDQFLDFLKQNPDLKQELQLLDNVRIPEEEIVFPGKRQLYKNAADENISFENKAVSFLEGDMDEQERKLFETYLASDPELQKEYNLFTKTGLIVDTGIKYPEKRKLYRKSGSVILMNWVARAAAVVVLLWGINSMFQTENQPVPQKPNQEFAKVSPIPTPPVKIMESEKKLPETEVQDQLKTVKESNATKTKSIQDQPKGSPGEMEPANSEFTERDLTALAEITPILAQLEVEPVGNQLAVSRSINVEKINDPRNIMTIEEFLASRAKKVGNESLLSAQRIVRLGLGVASELSGERIGYSMKDGKISSLDFESKLMAFSIPLRKY